MRGISPGAGSMSLSSNLIGSSSSLVSHSSHPLSPSKGRRCAVPVDNRHFVDYFDLAKLPIDVHIFKNPRNTLYLIFNNKSITASKLLQKYYSPPSVRSVTMPKHLIK